MNYILAGFEIYVVYFTKYPFKNILLIIYVSNVYEKIVAPKKIWCYKNVLKISQAKNTILDAFKAKSSY